MKTFPNKVISKAYEEAKGKVFRKHSTDLTYIDLCGAVERTR